MTEKIKYDERFIPCLNEFIQKGKIKDAFVFGMFINSQAKKYNCFSNKTVSVEDVAAMGKNYSERRVKRTLRKLIRETRFLKSDFGKPELYSFTKKGLDIVSDIEV